jgi:hypothetical protein
MQPWSWSRDSDRLAGTRAGAGGILVFSFKTGTYEALTNFGSTPVWLADDRRLMFAFEDRLFVVDSRTKETKEIYTFPQSRVAFVEGGGFNITRDSRTIYAAPIVREGDIWMATAK